MFASMAPNGKKTVRKRRKINGWNLRSLAKQMIAVIYEIVDILCERLVSFVTSQVAFPIQSDSQNVTSHMFD
jgi:hypothetical protein